MGARVWKLGPESLQGAYRLTLQAVASFSWCLGPD